MVSHRSPLPACTAHLRQQPPRRSAAMPGSTAEPRAAARASPGVAEERPHGSALMAETRRWLRLAGNSSDSLAQDRCAGNVSRSLAQDTTLSDLAFCPVPSDERHWRGVTWGASIGVAGPRALAGVRLPLELMHFRRAAAASCCATGTPATPTATTTPATPPYPPGHHQARPRMPRIMIKHA